MDFLESFSSNNFTFTGDLSTREDPSTILMGYIVVNSHIKDLVKIGIKCKVFKGISNFLEAGGLLHYLLAVGSNFDE